MASVGGASGRLQAETPGEGSWEPATRAGDDKAGEGGAPELGVVDNKSGSTQHYNLTSQAALTWRGL